MGSLKRKEASVSSSGPSKPAKSGGQDAGRPSKRAKADKADKAADLKPKSEKKGSDAAAAPLVSQLKEDEPLFPRGGGSVLTPLEFKQIQVQAKNDALFDQQAHKSSDKADRLERKKQKSKRKQDENAKVAAQGLAEDSVKIESLNYKRLVKGSLVLGQISDVSPLEVTVVLPNNLVGHLSATSISQTLNDRIEAEAANASDEEDDDKETPDGDDVVDLKKLFTVGEYVRACVLSTEDDTSETRNKRRIELSIRPEQANAGLADQDVVRNCTVMASVASVEDRGFVMDLGLAGSDVRGFLPKRELDPSIPEERMQPGAVLLCLVTSKDPNGKVAQLSTQKRHLGTVKNVPSDAVTISTFLPGTAVEVLLSEVNGRGFAGKVLGHLDATADMIHSGAGSSDVDLDDKYQIASKVKARVICTFPTADSPKIGVSVLPHIASLGLQTVGSEEDASVQQKPPTDVLPLSSVVDNCVVRRAELNVGLWVDVGVEGVPGFVHISRVKDGKVDALYGSSGPYKVGSVHRGRVLGYSAMDGNFFLSFEQRVLDQPYLRIEDLPVGEVVPGTIKKMIVNETGVAGLIVEVADGISGLVPEMHLSDVKLQHPEKKFREGMKIKARVLSTDPSKHQFRLTLKKTLVNSDTPSIKSFDDLSLGLRCLGTIINVVPIGAYVQFYGDLRGFLPVGEMSEAIIKDPTEHFRIGQVVSVRVLQFDRERNKCVVSCKDPGAFGVEKQLAFQTLEPGNIVAAKVVGKHEDSVEVELADSGLKAVLPVGHLSDRSAAKNAAALKRIHVGQTLPSLLILDKHDGRRAVTVSQKSSLITASQEGKLVTSVEGVRVGDSISGFVRNITPTAVFVQFAAHIVALLPKSLMLPSAQDEPDFGLHSSQSITVRVVSVENGRIVVSLRPEKRPTENDSSNRALENPVDGALTNLDDVRVGLVTQARITSVKATQLNVKLADNALGRIDVTEVFDKWEDIPNKKRPLRGFHENQIVQVRVLGVHDARKRVYLPITQRSSRSVFELSAKPSSLEAREPPEAVTIEKVEPESSWVGFVNNRGANCLWVSLSPNVRGRLYGMEASNDLSLVKDLGVNFPVGMALQVRVMRVDADRGRIDLSARSPNAEDEMDWSTVGTNMVLPARVSKVDDRQVVVELSKSVSGPIYLVDLADDYDQAVTTSYFKNDIVRVSVVSVDEANKRIRFSTRPSRVLNSSLPVEDPEITSFADVQPGKIIRGFVRSVSDKGLFVNLGGDVVALVRITDLSDQFLKDWKAHFRVDQLVKGRVVSVNAELKQVQMSLKASVVDDNYVPLSTLADFKEGQIVTGRVRKVEEFGAFVVIDNTANVSGLCHRSEMADKRVRDARKLYKEGDVVKAKVLSINRETSRISLGLKPAYFEDEDDDDSDASMSTDGDHAGVRLEDADDRGYDSNDSDDEMDDAQGALLITGTDNDIDMLDDDVSEDDQEETGEAPNGAGLSGGGFDWSGALADRDENGGNLSANSDDEAGTTQNSKSTKRKKGKIDDLDRTAELDVSGPQTASDFERLLLGQPDSSALWIAYMAFQLQVSELAKARDVAERAIKTINVREETERLNVWIAYLNLEVVYGTDETAEEVFKRACQYNDQREVCERTASIYIQSGKHNKADELFQTMTKKFGAQLPQIWINYAHFLHHSLREADRARALLPRALQMLDKHAHLSLTARFAALEFRSPEGNPERGRTVFEGLLDAWPKKFDLWNQLLDLETSVFAAEKAKGAKGNADPTVVRDVFERGAKVKGLKARRAKAWFQRWAKWEELHGDTKSRGRVSARAKEWAADAERKKAEANEGDDSE